MNLFESIYMAIKNVFSNKMRALLTMLGIIIGIGSVIIITSIGAGSQAQINEQFASMGVGRITITQRGGRNISTKDLLSLKDYELLKNSSEIGPLLKYISPVYTFSSGTVKLLNPKESKSASITGVTSDYEQIMSPTLLYGRYISENDCDMASKVVVINDTTAEKVFGYSDVRAIGKKITIKTNRGGSMQYTVVGILENKNASMESMYNDQFPESMIMPINSLMRMTGSKTISSISAVVNDSDKATEVSSQITEALDKSHGTTDKYYVQNLEQFKDQMTSMTSMMTTLISAIAGISLVVGGIGVMNIMLVTVTERTREIGIRKSIGAKNNDIRFQFLVESVILTGMGGILGLLLGYGGGEMIGNLMNIKAIVSIDAVMLAVGISTGIGIIFGVYPAGKAAKLDPIEALRYE